VHYHDKVPTDMIFIFFDKFHDNHGGGSNMSRFRTPNMWGPNFQTYQILGASIYFFNERFSMNIFQ
jgi:hypothetical protein